MDIGEGGNEGRTPLDEPVAPEQQPWSRRAQAMAAVVWPSFLAAAGSTMLFFAFVDPLRMGDALSHPVEFSRMTGYGVGFFFFWLVTFTSSAISVYLCRTARRDIRARSVRK